MCPSTLGYIEVAHGSSLLFAQTTISMWDESRSQQCKKAMWQNLRVIIYSKPKQDEFYNSFKLQFCCEGVFISPIELLR